MEPPETPRYQMVLFAGAVLTVSCFYLLSPVRDNDFFWHLKTGEWILENKRLLTEDIFSYTTPLPLGTFQHFVLTGYWLSQLIYAVSYLYAGMEGIVILRFVIFSALMYCMWSRRKGDPILYASLLMLFVISLVGGFPFERPQAFSFVFFAFLLGMLEKTVSNPVPRLFSKGSVAVAALMIVWANSHGGYLLGQVTLLVYMLMEGAKFVHPSLQPVTKETYGSLLVLGVIGIAFSLISPNTYHGYEMLRPNTFMLSLNREYKSTLEVLRHFRDYGVLLWWSIMLLTAVAFFIHRRVPNLTQIALISGLGYYSFVHVRYMPFFLIAALPVVSEGLSGKRFTRLARRIAVPAALLVAIIFARDEATNLNNIQSGDWIQDERFPVKAADFILANGLKGNMYNHFNWGGYLIWRLAPERKVFVDGRCLNEEVDWQAYAISLAYAGREPAAPLWKQLLQRYDVRYIIIPPMFSSGRPLPLANELMKSEDWALVVSDVNSMLFVRNTLENAETIRNHSLPKKILYR